MLAQKIHSELVSSVKKAAYLEGEFITRAGKKTNYYIDKYLFETRPDILMPLAIELAKCFPSPETYDRIAAPELGAVPLAAVVSLQVKKPFIIVKKAVKGYGTQKLIEGAFNPGERVVVLEDVLTTGGAVLRACDIIKENKLSIVKIIGVINREEGAFENIHAQGYEVDALISTTDLRSC
ncbi:orotate phosphoribosyltransferase [Thermoproteota archaeon]